MARCFEPSAEACTDDGFDDGWVWRNDDDHPELLWSNSFVEGNAWHYLWYVPYDVDAMIRVQHGGDREAYLERTRTYWRDQVFLEEDDVLPDDYYWHGNEPVMHYAFMGSLAGDVDITAEASRWVLANRYAHDPAGLDGNDDAGTLSAWFLLASTGVFPVAGTTTYAVASPLWERLEIDRADAEHGDRRNDKGEFQGYGPPGLVQKPMQQPPCQTGQAGDHAALSCSPAAARRTSRSAPEARST